MTKEDNPRKPKLALGLIILASIELVLSQNFERNPQVLDMLFLGTRIDQNVVDKKR